MTRLALLLTAVTLAVPASASAQADNPFAPLPPAPPAPQVTPTPPQNRVDDGTISTELLFGMIGGVLLILSIIAYVITRDARRSLPKDAIAREPVARDAGPHRHERDAKAKARKKARAQRQARKKTRKR